MSAAHRSVMRRNVSVIDINRSNLGGRRSDSRLPHLVSVSGHPTAAAAPIVPQTSRSAYDRRWFGFFSSRVRTDSSSSLGLAGSGGSGPGLAVVAGAGAGSGAGGSSFTLTSDGSTATVLDSASASSGGVMSRSYSVGDTELLIGPLNSFGSLPSQGLPTEGVPARPTVSLDAGVMVMAVDTHNLGGGVRRGREWSHHYGRGVDDDDARSASSAHSDPGQRADSLRLGLGGTSMDAKSMQAVDGRRHHHHHHKHKALHSHARSPHDGRLHRDSPRQRRHSGGALDTPLPDYGDMLDGEIPAGAEEEGSWAPGLATATVSPTNAAGSVEMHTLPAQDAGQGAGEGGVPRTSLRSVVAPCLSLSLCPSLSLSRPLSF